MSRFRPSYRRFPLLSRARLARPDPLTLLLGAALAGILLASFAGIGHAAGGG